METLYTKTEMMKRFENIIDSVLQQDNKNTIKSVSEMILTGMHEIGKLLLTSWLQNALGTGYTRSKIIVKEKPDYKNSKLGIYTFNGYRKKQYLSIFGTITLKRAYYCGWSGGYIPLEERYPWLKDERYAIQKI